MSWLEATLRWYGVLLLVSLAWAPWVALLGWRLPDRGATLVRPLGLLATIYPGWLLAQTTGLPYTEPLLAGSLAVAGVAGWAVLLRRGAASRAWLASLLATEALAIVAFLGYIWLRGFTPAIQNTEKPMESAFLLSSRLTTAMPPPDPWLAGEPINYYYLGYLLHGSVARLAAIPGTTAFNLALATTFSMAVVAAAGIGWNLGRHWFSRRPALVGATLTVLLVLLVGNLYAAERFIAAPRAVIDAGWWDNANGVGWRASRIVCDGPRVDNACPDRPSLRAQTINEFPSFSFILGDLHPHVLALPFTLAALGLGFLVLLTGLDLAHRRRAGPADWARIAGAGAVIGSLYALNSWDFPTYLAVAAAGLLWASRGRWRLVAALVVASVVPWLPFTLTYVPPAAPAATALPEWLRSLPLVPRLFSLIGVHLGERTSIDEFLTIFGVPWLIALALIGFCLWRDQASLRAERPVVVAALLMTTLLAIALDAPLLVVCGWPLLGALLLLRDRPVSPESVALGLIALALALVIGTEFVYILDVFNSRMNTLFKVYYQAWTLLGVAGAVAILVLWRAAARSVPRQVVLVVGVATGLIAGLLSPVLSSRAWTDGFRDWQGLDGIAYVASFSQDELAALRWLQVTATPDDVLLEVVGCSYQVNSGVPMGRAATFSGIPTVLNWPAHEDQWRKGQPALLAALPRREADVAAMYADPQSPLFDTYGVTLLYVGRYERDDWQRICSSAGPYAGLDAPGYPGPGWTAVFTSGDVTIYRRDGAVARP